MHNPLIAALDVPSAERGVALAEAIGPWVGALKVGSELFTSAGPDFVRKLRAAGARVFLDLKFHDIPNTVAKAVAAATRLDIQMLTVHTSGGEEMMRAAETSARETAASLGTPPPLVLGVTVLTSMDARQLASVSLEDQVERQVERLARLAVAAGLRGLVCSPLELPRLRAVLPPTMALVTPGIRIGQPAGSDDQKRTLAPEEAIAAGANWLVVGRPIYAAPDPKSATLDLRKRLGLSPSAP
ncbi:MAG: orotidine-5'-phosphate decarboxylase [Verrucomicrobiales bacterium]|nr:orotidine-5'-phosphate decarboxylase [Verrucomicrobiales bacterium]